MEEETEAESGFREIFRTFISSRNDMEFWKQFSDTTYWCVYNLSFSDFLRDNSVRIRFDWLTLVNKKYEVYNGKNWSLNFHI